MRIGLVGTRGVPAAYGGFETAVEEIGKRLIRRGHDVVVYCRRQDPPRPSYLGMTLVHRPALRAKALETLTHTALSAEHLRRRPVDAAVVFNVANAPFVRPIQAAGMPVAVHVDGLEWRRGKWGPLGRRYYRWAEALAVRHADCLIADSRAIGRHYSATYGVAPEYIPYGAEIVEQPQDDRLAEVGARPGAYHLVVARFEPENNVHLLLESFSRSAARLPLMVVGGAPYGRAYTLQIEALAARDPRIRLLGCIYDQALLDQLYGHTRSYLHGHSVGGTNPSLLRAMAAGAAISAFDVEFNREVAGTTARYFSSAPQLARLVEESEQEWPRAAARGQAARERVAARYRWDDVADSYEQLCRDLARARRTTRSGVAAATLLPRSGSEPGSVRSGASRRPAW